MGSKDDEKICREIEKNFPTVKNLCDKTDLFDLGKLSKNSFLSIGNDTGPMHLIAKGGNDFFIAKGVSIPPNSAIELIQGGAKIVLDSTNTLEAVSDTASSLDVTLSYIDTISS